MNLLDKYVPKKDILHSSDLYTINEFREVQYTLIPELIRNSMMYLQRISNEYFVLKSIKEQSQIRYLDAFGYDISKIIVNIENPENRSEEIPFISFNIPKLVKKSFFYLNGSYYSPCIYILDKPVIYKKNSIKLSGLINSVTMFFKVGNTRAIFGGKNIPIEYFIQWFLKDDISLLERLEDMFKINNTRYSQEQLIDFYGEFLSCEPNAEKIESRFNELFFDEYTRNLYSRSYGREFTFTDLVYYAIANYVDEKIVHFVDLNEKRLIFVEMLLMPFFQRIGDMAFNFIRGQRFNSINFNENEIIKFFMVDLKHQFFYDLVNFYSGILTHKASMLNPNSSRPPSEISSVHPSHFARLCPITISAKKPGESVSIVPDAKVDKYGIFR